MAMREDYGGDGFDDFVRTEIPRLMRLATLLSGSRNGAWDLVQETLVRVGLRWSRLDQTGNPYAYAQRTLVNINISTWRRLHRELPTWRANEQTVTADETWLIELRESLLPALRSLPPRQRAVVVLRYFEDLTEAECAERLGCALGTVKSQHAKALQKLRLHLSHETDGKSIEARSKR